MTNEFNSQKTINLTSLQMHSNYDNWVKRENYIYFYAIAMCFVFYFVVHRSFAFFKMCLRASVNLHDKLFCNITRATIGFFQANPSGRILNRFSKDIGAIDTLLPVAMVDCIMVRLNSTLIQLIICIYV